MPVHLVDHPLVHDALVDLRDTQTTHGHFRRVATRVTLLLAVDAMRDIPTVEVSVETPLGTANGRRVTADIVVVPVLRAGLSMLDPILTLVPGARVGYVGLQRDEETALASLYYSKLPAGLDESFVLIVDPMLATGGSAVRALDLLRDAGAIRPHLVCIVAAPEGLARVEREHPDVVIHTCAIDRELNARKYIVPGLGDFGDRLYGTH